MGIGNRFSGLFLACLVGLACGSARADSDEEALARQLFELTNADQIQQTLTEPLVEAVSHQVLKDVKTRLSSNGIELDDDTSEAMRDFVSERYRILLEEATVQGKERLVAHYVETFSKEELAELTAAYKKPAVQRMMALTPGWTTELAQMGEHYARENINQVLYEPLKAWLDSNVDVE